MKRVLYLLLVASFGSLQSEELAEMPIISHFPFSEQIEETNPVLSASELEDFTEGSGLSSKELTSGKDPFSYLAEPMKNRFYFLMPNVLNGFNNFFLPGFSFRHYLDNGNFIESSYFNNKFDLSLTKHNEFHEIESKKKLTTVYDNIINACYGFKWNTRYVDPYFSLAAGIYLPYVKSKLFSYIDLLPAITSALGFEFGYGFFDLAITYLPIGWITRVKYQGKEFEYYTRISTNFRLGIGF